MLMNSILIEFPKSKFKHKFEMKEKIAHIVKEEKQLDFLLFASVGRSCRSCDSHRAERNSSKTAEILLKKKQRKGNNRICGKNRIMLHLKS